MATSSSPYPAYSDSNIFAKIIKGDIPCYKIFETDHCIAFLDAFPSAPGHSLLIPKKHGYSALEDMPEEEAASVLKELPRLCKMVRCATGCEGVNVIQNSGKAAGQEVFHVHFHVIPRVGGDGLLTLPKSSKSMIEGKDAEEMLQKLKTVGN